MNSQVVYQRAVLWWGRALRTKTDGTYFSLFKYGITRVIGYSITWGI